MAADAPQRAAAAGTAASRLRRALEIAAQVLQASALTPNGLRIAILRATGLAIGAHVRIYHSTFFSGDCTVGDGSFISIGCTVDGSAPVSIGRHVSMAMGVRLVTSSHAIGPPSKRAGEPRNAPITIGDGCWLGAGCTVLPGVTIGAGCVVAAGALVTRDAEPDGLYVGVPARRVRTLGG